MQHTRVREELFPDCPIRNVLSRISCKWPMLVLFTLSQRGTLRFNTLRRALPNISQKMLTATLRTLEEDGLVVRQVYAEVPPRVEYGLTERARSLLPILDELVDWAHSNMVAIMRDRQRHAGGEPAAV